MILGVSIDRILLNHRMHPYSYNILQHLNPENYAERVEFCEFILVKIQEDPLFLSKVIWTDESKFSREGIVNRRNIHYWNPENPHIIRMTNFQNRFSFNVFILMIGDQLRYEIYDENLNSEGYLEIVRGCVSTFCDDLPLNILRKYWYQMDGAPAHSSRKTSLELYRMFFDDRWIGNRGPWQWPSRSPSGHRARRI